MMLADNFETGVFMNMLTLITNTLENKKVYEKFKKTLIQSIDAVVSIQVKQSSKFNATDIVEDSNDIEIKYEGELTKAALLCMDDNSSSDLGQVKFQN